jgi:hypothetical protein
MVEANFDLFVDLVLHILLGLLELCARVSELLLRDTQVVGCRVELRLCLLCECVCL